MPFAGSMPNDGKYLLFDVMFTLFCAFEFSGIFLFPQGRNATKFRKI